MLLLILLAPAAPAQDVQFNRDIRPILSNKCFLCHGPDEKKRKADLRLDLRGEALADLGGYSAIVPGKPDESELLARVGHEDPSELMPPPESKRGALTKTEVALLRRWIEQGAPYQGHWAFEPVAGVGVPESWTGNPIDYFVGKRLEEAGITPSPPASPEILLRRLHLDLTGLLPTLEEQQSFSSSPRPGAVIERLLASPHFGERWGRHWLDQARYADSHGYSIDGDRQMWPFRDWVIKAHNDDLPFDQFTIAQLAGDLLPGRSKLQHIASAFHRNTLINQEGGSDREQFRVESVIDRVNTTGAVWLGLTVGCAQCHTHKFDPITQREYYQLFAFFNNTEDANSTGATVEVEEFEILGNAPTPPARSGEGGPVKWNPVRYGNKKSLSGAPLHPVEGNSLLVDKTAGPNDGYQVDVLTYLDEVASVRLRVLPHKSLPRKGPGKSPNGNFFLSSFSLHLSGNELQIADAFADHEQPGHPVSATFDASKETGWAINVGEGQRAITNAEHEAVFNLATPIKLGGQPLTVVMEHGNARHPTHLIGRFAIEVSDKRIVPPQPSKKPSPPRKGKVMVMKELPKHRPTFLLTRGDFTRPMKEAGEVSPGVLAHVRPAFPASKHRPTRLDLARWLVHPENPLTPRVTVNRIWMRYFGRGLVETEEDFGTQGTLPTHPELLDYLSRRFVEDGWSMKALHRLIVTSKTYQRSSHARPDLKETDASNILLARQNRIRLEGEIVRDAALSASGLLTPTLGGPGVYPPQPPGIYAFTQARKNWKTSTGVDRYRRGMYIFFYRSAPYPLLQTFDAPDFQTTCTRRPRSNTPLQALTVANDPALLELAQGFAERIQRELPTGDSAARIVRACQLALCRPPSERELLILTDYYDYQARDFATDTAAASKLVTKAMREGPGPYTATAALVCVTRALLNTDNFITRE